MVWDNDKGKLLFEISKFDTDILYFTSVAKGSGSGNVGLEWAGEGEGGVIQFQRVGPKVLVVEKNLRFRAGNGGAGLAQDVDQSFPDSILAALPVIRTEAGKVTVDATPLVIRDAVGFAAPRGGRGGGGGVRSPTRRIVPRQLALRPGAQRDLSAAHKGLSEEHRSRSHRHL